VRVWTPGPTFAITASVLLVCALAVAFYSAAEPPASGVPVTTAEKYVSAVTIAFLAILILYVVINGPKLARLERAIAELEAARRPDNEP
jgi:hypothetical protein